MQNVIAIDAAARQGTVQGIIAAQATSDGFAT
jgi:hypothetical protein